MAEKKEPYTPNHAGGGVPSLKYADRNRAKAEKRMQLIVDVDRAIITKDYTALVKLERECEGLPILKKIKEALNG